MYNHHPHPLDLGLWESRPSFTLTASLLHPCPKEKSFFSQEWHNLNWSAYKTNTTHYSVFAKLHHKYCNDQRMLAQVLTEVMVGNQLPLKHPECISRQIFIKHPPGTRHKVLSRQQNWTSYYCIGFLLTGVILRVSEGRLLCVYKGCAAVTSTQWTYCLSSPVLYSISPQLSPTKSPGSKNPECCALPSLNTPMPLLRTLPPVTLKISNPQKNRLILSSMQIDEGRSICPLTLTPLCHECPQSSSPCLQMSHLKGWVKFWPCLLTTILWRQDSVC